MKERSLVVKECVVLPKLPLNSLHFIFHLLQPRLHLFALLDLLPTPVLARTALQPAQFALQL